MKALAFAALLLTACGGKTWEPTTESCNTPAGGAYSGANVYTFHDLPDGGGSLGDEYVHVGCPYGDRCAVQLASGFAYGVCR